MKAIVLLLFFLMILAAPIGAVWFAFATWGTPHLVTSYTFRNNGDPYNPYAERHYLTCTYWGHLGSFTVVARHGRCPWVRFFTASSLERESR